MITLVFFCRVDVRDVLRIGVNSGGDADSGNGRQQPEADPALATVCGHLQWHRYGPQRRHVWCHLLLYIFGSLLHLSVYQSKESD